MKQFEIPSFYRSGFITGIKRLRSDNDRRKLNLQPTTLDFGPVRFLFARHFGFCYGVENAIEISYRAIEENPGKRLFLLSEMIHNPHVNEDLQGRGIRFLMDTSGKRLIDWKELSADDVVIVPAFGTTIEIETELAALGVSLAKYNTTCPFVEKVWKRSNKLGAEGYTVVIHGKNDHEETRATFSHAQSEAASVVVRDMDETIALAKYVTGEANLADFHKEFEGRFSEGFDVKTDLQRVGVVNQTTMLATETQAIADYLKKVMSDKFDGEADHFADTRDTLCYATNDNQKATQALLEESADLAIVVGGYNSSNTAHIVELCEEKLPTYFIGSDNDILDEQHIQHWDVHKNELVTSKDFIKSIRPANIIVTSGASCPDSMVERVVLKLLSFFENCNSVEAVVEQVTEEYGV
ncbi:MAG: 4-hydroxy-3-methylbut-2-enyl diphosphate reductase [Flavobacteriales bacterium]|jgi:4-hydroxy-3-methylbut-2-enyl diphosphate reductase